MESLPVLVFLTDSAPWQPPCKSKQLELSILESPTVKVTSPITQTKLQSPVVMKDEKIKHWFSVQD